VTRRAVEIHLESLEETGSWNVTVGLRVIDRAEEFVAFVRLCPRWGSVFEVWREGPKQIEDEDLRKLLIRCAHSEVARWRAYTRGYRPRRRRRTT
jgi:hypothetical protein